jgi:hypothetical protein
MTATPRISISVEVNQHPQTKIQFILRMWFIQFSLELLVEQLSRPPAQVALTIEALLWELMSFLWRPQAVPVPTNESLWQKKEPQFGRML